MKKIRILIVDDHPIISEGLVSLLTDHPEISVVGVAGDGEQGLAQLRRLRPDCMVVDLGMPNLGGFEAIPLYLKEKPDLGIVVFTGYKNETLLDEVLQAGARAYVLKGVPVSVLVSAILEVNRGGYWVSPELNATIIRRYLSQQGKTPLQTSEYDTLSAREKQVFLLLAKGISPREVAEKLFISPKTVSKHVAAIKRKLKVKNAAQMANYAAKIGLGPSLEP